MSSYYSRKRALVPAGGTLNYGVEEDPNPGESFRSIEGPGTTQTLAGTSNAGASGGGNQQPIGVGAQVGIMRNLEFSAGGRAHRISTGPYRKA